MAEGTHQQASSEDQQNQPYAGNAYQQPWSGGSAYQQRYQQAYQRGYAQSYGAAYGQQSQAYGQQDSAYGQQGYSAGQYNAAYGQQGQAYDYQGSAYGQQGQSYGQQYYYTQQPYNAYVRTKDHVVAGLIAIFLGCLGIHKFYLGYNTAGFIMLGVTILGSIFTLGLAGGVMGVIGLIEGIIYLTKTQTAFDAEYVYGNREWF